MTCVECQGENHRGKAVPAIARIVLIDLEDDPAYIGHCVCPMCLGDFIKEVCLNDHTDLQLSFRVEPA